MKYIFIYLFILLFVACESHGFEGDRRQMLAIRETKNKVPGTRSFSVTGFKEDTLQSWTDTSIKHPIQYTIDFVYKDSGNVLQKKRGLVIFAPQGYAILNSQIVDRQ